MSGVLAVMDGVVIDYETLLPECAATVREARGAVAELTKRAQETVERFEDDYDMSGLRAALARVQGGQS